MSIETIGVCNCFDMEIDGASIHSLVEAILKIKKPGKRGEEVGSGGRDVLNVTAELVQTTTKTATTTNNVF